jgi:hypothetical protein
MISIGKIVDYESGEMPEEDVIPFFAELVQTGMAWTLQGSYGRMAASLIEGGYISREGKVLNQE